jgi:isopentenyl-diphosphate Delta-isomerase
MNYSEVVLVNEHDEAMGVMEKMEAHRNGLLHRAFSVFIFNQEGKMLLQQRALDKYHSGGLWTNACCSHPQPGDEMPASAQKRLNEEMGFTAPLEKIFEFIYRHEFDNGLIEYELDHVWAGEYGGSIHPDKEEVMAASYQPVNEIEKDLILHPEKFTAWFHIAFPKIKDWWRSKYENAGKLE